jgi:hypothetical protein
MSAVLTFILYVFIKYPWMIQWAGIGIDQATLKMEAVVFCAVLVPVFQTMWCDILEDCIIKSTSEMTRVQFLNGADTSPITTILSPSVGSSQPYIQEVLGTLYKG